MAKPTPINKESTVKPDAFLVSKTDLKGHITYCNPPFIEITGYSEQELLKKPHNIIRHPDMPKTIFDIVWKVISSGLPIQAIVKNKTKEEYLCNLKT